MNVQIPVKWLQELLALCSPEDHELRERVMASITAMNEQAARPVVTPEPDAAIKEVMELVGTAMDSAMKAGELLLDSHEKFNAQFASAKSLKNSIESKLRALLAAGGEAQAAPAFYAALGSNGCALPQYSAGTEEGVILNVLSVARNEGYTGSGLDRLIELGWVVRPVYTRPTPATADSLATATGLPAQAVLDYPWRDRLLDGRELVRDQQGFAEHPELPLLDEGMKPRAFFAALGVEMKHTMADDDLSMDEYDAMSDAENWSAWIPQPPIGGAWNLVAIFDTEDGPAAWWARALKESREASPQAQADARDAAPTASEQDALTPVMLGSKLFSFSCFQDWVNGAQRAWKQARVSSELTICLDQKGRVLQKGLEFMRADKEGAFPVDVYLALVDDTLRYDAAIAAQAAAQSKG